MPETKKNPPRNCFICNGTGLICNTCGEPEGVCGCPIGDDAGDEPGQDFCDCQDCEGTGIASADRGPSEGSE